jgi:hypothetical protein
MSSFFNLSKTGLLAAGIQILNKVQNLGKSQTNESVQEGTLLGAEEVPSGTFHGAEEVPSGTFCSSESIKGGALCARSFTPGAYRSEDGKHLFRFNFIDCGGYIQIDILEQPSYNGLDSSSHVSHRLSSQRGGHKICIANEPKTIEEAIKLAAAWSELTSRYLETGVTIDEQISRNVRKRAEESKKDKPKRMAGLLNWFLN